MQAVVASLPIVTSLCSFGGPYSRTQEVALLHTLTIRERKFLQHRVRILQMQIV